MRNMNSRQRYIATSHLRETLEKQERSAAWLARKIGVSQQLMSFVLRNERTLGEDKAMLTAAVLAEDVAFLFTPIVTDVTKNSTRDSERTAA
jgi:transcriptional regulator with XRE-family HTH domain